MRSFVPTILGAKMRGVAADVSAAEGLRCLVKAVTNAEILVNNAGIFEPNFQISPTKIDCGSSIPT